MFSVLNIMARILFSPVWILWKGYNGLWWAFDDTPTPTSATGGHHPWPEGPTAAGGGGVPCPEPLSRTDRVKQDRSFEIIDSRKPAPSAPRPLGALRGGFIGSLASSALFAWGTHTLASHEVLKTQTATYTWLWASCMIFVGSIFVVRHVARRQAAQQPTTFWGRVKTTFGGMKDAAASVGSGAKSAATSVRRTVTTVMPASRLASIRNAAEGITRRVVGAFSALRNKPRQAPVTDHA